MAVLNLPMLASGLVTMWINIISWFSSLIPNYAWAVILLTVIIKLVLTPLDFFNKRVTKKNAQMQKVIQPEMKKLQDKYGDNPSVYNQKMSELYKSHNYNVMGSCLFVIFNLVITLVIFISLLNGLNAMASNRIFEQYKQLNQTYHTAYTQAIDSSLSNEQAIESANESVLVKYDEVKDSWLWIKNVWKADTTTSSILTFDEFVSISKEVILEGNVVNLAELQETQKEQAKAEYEKVMTPLREEIGGVNGYFILLVLIVATSFLSQWLMQRKTNAGAKSVSPDSAAGATKIMMFVLPVLLGVFALSSNSVFSLYLLTSQIIAIMMTPVIDLVLDKLENKKQATSTSLSQPEYSRTRTSNTSTFAKNQTNGKQNNKNKKRGN